MACNSSWTRSHIEQLWNPKNVRTIYPPCDTDFFIDSIKLDGGLASQGSDALKKAYGDPAAERSKRQNIVLSFAQFRPEKDHQL